MKTVLWFAGLSALFLLPVTLAAQSAKNGHVTPFEKLEFPAGPGCLKSAIEHGDPSTGPSTMILKASPNCVVPWHTHTAEEQLMVTSGTFLAEMEGETPTRLGSGGFAVMPGGHKHQFACRSETACVAFISFSQKYDIVWVDKKGSYVDQGSGSTK